MKKKNCNYRRISFPYALLEKVQSHIESKPEYQNISDFIREAIREKIRNELIEDYEIKNKDDEEDVEILFDPEKNTINNDSKGIDSCKGEISMFV